MAYDIQKIMAEIIALCNEADAIMQSMLATYRAHVGEQ